MAETRCVCRPERQQVHWQGMWAYCLDSVVVLLYFSLLATCNTELIRMIVGHCIDIHVNTEVGGS